MVCIPYASLLNHLITYKESSEIDERLASILLKLTKKFSGEIRSSRGADPYLNKVVDKIKIILSNDEGVSIFGDEKYSREKYRDVLRDAYIAFYNGLHEARKNDWEVVFKTAKRAEGSKPSVKWLTEMKKVIAPLGEKSYIKTIVDLMEASKSQELYWVGYGQVNLFYEKDSSTMLRGLVWGLLVVDYREVLVDLGGMCEFWYGKEPRFGPRSTKLGNACLYVLAGFSEPETISVLCYLKTRVKFRQGLRLTDKYLKEAAREMDVSPDELEDMTAPDFSFNLEGVYEQAFDAYTYIVAIDDSGGFSKYWLTPSGKKQKSEPAEVKKTFPRELNQVKKAYKTISKTYTSQKKRIEKHYITGHSMHYRQWLERYIHRGFMNTIARRLIWRFDVDGANKTGIWHGDAVVDVDLSPLEGLSDATRVQPWHPIQGEPDQVFAWRDALDSLHIRQPFKQAYREVYILTDAERKTFDHSLRFAGHILKQSQVASLARDRGWTCSFEGPWDSPFSLNKKIDGQDYFIEFEESGLAHELEAASDTGEFLYIGTGKVVFWNSRGEKTPLEEIPDVVFSEMMRDVDLFVSVASVGNDADLDVIQEARLLSYWKNYSSEALRETGKTRKAALEKVISRLKFSDRCSFDDRNVYVKGDLAAYKIHIGSGNVFVEPGSRYVCIVRDSKQTRKSAIMLPFDEDYMLSLVLSKVQFLVNDKKIKDPSILSQIQTS